MPRLFLNSPLLLAGLLLCGSVFTSRPAFAHGDLQERIKALDQRMQSADAEDAGLYLERAGLYRLHGDTDHALADVESASAIDPSLPRLDWLRAQLLQEAGRSREALLSVNRLLKNDPTHADAFQLRARIHTRLGNGKAAAGDFTQAIIHMKHPGPDCYLERAESLLALPAPDMVAVLRGLDEGILALGPVPSLQVRAIDVERARGNTTAALERLQALIDRSPTNAQLLRQKGDLLRETGQVEQAKQTYHAALKQMPPSRRSSRTAQALMASLHQRLSELRATP